jgi:hypothetical protein
MNDKTATPIKQAAQVIKSSADIQIRNIDMPVLMWSKRLHEPGPFLTGLLVPPIQEPCLRKNTPSAGWAYGNYISVEHHESEPSISFKGVVDTESDDGFPLPFFQPEITRDRRIMLIGLSVTIHPRVEFALADRKPCNKHLHLDSRFFAPCSGEVNNGVSCIMGNPDAI